MPKTILLLKPCLSTLGQSVNVSPVRIYCCTQEIEDSGKISANRYPWTLRQSDGDYRSTNELFNKLQNVPVSGKPLIEFVVYENVSYWQFLPSYIWPIFFKSIEFIKVVTSIIEETSPNIIRVFPAYDSNFLIWREIMQSIGEAYRIKVVFEKPNLLSYFYSPRDQFKYFLDQIGITGSIRKIYNATLNLCMKFMSDNGNCGKLKESDERKILFVTFGRHWVEIPGESGHFYDEQVYPLLPALRNAGWNRFIGVDCPYSLNSNLSIFWKRMRDTELGVVWRYFYSFGRMIKTGVVKKRARYIFLSQWKIIKNDHQFSEGFQYLGVKLMPALMREFKRSFLKILPECAQMFAIACEILAEEHPKAIILTYETGPYQRALIISAKRIGIPTIGLMHGMIFDNHYDYMHSNIISNRHQKPLGFVVPEITCVWGPLWKRSLTSFGNYPEEAVRITGNWRYDEILKTLRNINIRELKQRFKVPPDKKIVLVVSDGLNTVDYVSQCLGVLLKFHSVVTLIKPHPADNPAFVLEILQKYGLPKRLLIEGRLIEALFISDLVISQISTVLSEAALLEKDIILANFQDLKGWETYLETGFFLSAKNCYELNNAIKHFLYEDSVKKDLSLARAKFVSDCFFKVDGYAAKRVVDALEERIKGLTKLQC